jgi:serine/threonine protein kinase/tetratricopeptide (TPR) repeat protein
MSAERWQRLTQIVNDCLELSADARSAHARTLCADDDALYREAMQWINDAEQTQGFLDQSADVDLLTLRPGAQDIARRADAALQWTGKRLGPYRVTEEIARGGMGSVFKAVRADDAYEQVVAIKVVRSHVATELIAQRFRAERQILANLEHPQIARLLDGGQSDDGTPYLVMEYVDGKPIDEYCESHGLSVNERLKLFRDVCSAVQYAHQRLIVHRDLKPSNILVGAAGQVKLLDFGIAKLLDSAQLDEHGNAIAMPTEANAMTPAYASPEQVKGEAITTASDVYALGVLLYRLLTGRSPYKANATQPLALAKEIIETDPERPSTVVTQPESPSPTERTVDTNEIKKNIRTLDSKRLRKELRGDLDNVVLMALRKEPNRRYATVEQLSDDVRRSQANEPVLARADTLVYRARKLVQRNMIAVGVAAIAAVTLAATAGVATYQAKRATAAQLMAEKHFATVRKIANELIFEVQGKLRLLPETLEANRVLLTKAKTYLEELERQSDGDFQLQKEIAASYAKLGLLQFDSSRPHLGDLSSAEESFRKARGFYSNLLNAGYESVNSLDEIATQDFQIAVTEIAKGKYRLALATLDSALVSLDGLNKRQLVPKQLHDIQITQVLLLTKRADVLSGLDGDPGATDLNRAINDLRRSNEISSEIIKSAPPNEKSVREYGLNMSKARVALVQAQLGQFAAAEAGLNEAIRTQQELTLREPNNPFFKGAEQNLRVFMSEVKSTIGDETGAQFHAENAENFYRILLVDTSADAGSVAPALQARVRYLETLVSINPRINIDKLFSDSVIIFRVWKQKFPDDPDIEHMHRLFHALRGQVFLNLKKNTPIALESFQYLAKNVSYEKNPNQRQMLVFANLGISELLGRADPMASVRHANTALDRLAELERTWIQHNFHDWAQWLVLYKAVARTCGRLSLENVSLEQTQRFSDCANRARSDRAKAIASITNITSKLPLQDRLY